MFVDKYIHSINIDGVTSGSDTEEGAVDLYIKSRQCMVEAGFNLRKLISNSPAVQAHISSQVSSTAATDDGQVTNDDSYMKNTLEEHEHLECSETVKMLGVKWRPADDVLIFDLSNLHSIASMAEPTKRNVIGLSTTPWDLFRL